MKIISYNITDTGNIAQFNIESAILSRKRRVHDKDKKTTMYYQELNYTMS